MDMIGIRWGKIIYSLSIKKAVDKLAGIICILKKGKRYYRNYNRKRVK